jgi:hypothetical protein
VAVLALACAAAFPSWAAEQQYKGFQNAFSLRWENDSFGGTDANYTNGLSIALTRTGNGLLGGVWDLFGPSEGKRSGTYELTQLQFTPVDLDRQVPDPGDRPYAGVLYLGLTTHLQRDESLQGLKFIAGVVGPASMSEALQRSTHRIINSTLPRGWGYQVRNEPIFNLLYEYRHKFRLAPRDAAVGVELIPVGGAALGNYQIQAAAEAQLRVGYHLREDFGATVLRGLGYLPAPDSPSWGFYAFTGGGASLVARDITLDGNSFMTSRSVDKRPLVPAIEFGAALWVWRFQTSFSYIMMGKEFYGQQVREDYGSILLSYFF